MKIIRVDNLDREGPGHDHVLIASGIRPGKEADTMLKALRASRQTDDWYRLVEDDHVLQKFEP